MDNPAPSSTIAISVAGLKKSFGGQPVLDGVSFEIPKGSITVLLGPSGTGKSVLLRLMVGLIKPDEGTIKVFGEDVGGLDERRPVDRRRLFAIRRRFGMLFQDGALFDDMSVFDNIAFPMRNHGLRNENEIRRRVGETLAQVGLPGVEEKSPSDLSGGMRKRVAFARAIVLKPEIVLCDEPSSGLDPVMAATLDELILEIHRSLGTTFVVISHDTAEARMIADTLGLLSQGKLLTFGPASDVLEENIPAVQQFFARSTTGPIKVL